MSVLGVQPKRSRGNGITACKIRGRGASSDKKAKQIWKNNHFMRPKWMEFVKKKMYAHRASMVDRVDNDRRIFKFRLREIKRIRFIFHWSTCFLSFCGEWTSVSLRMDVAWTSHGRRYSFLYHILEILTIFESSIVNSRQINCR